MNTPKKRNAPTFKDRIAIYNLIQKVTRKDGDYIAYIDGWSDERVAKETGSGHLIVAKVRVDALGKIKPSHDQMKYAELVAQVSQLQSRLDALCKRLGE